MFLVILPNTFYMKRSLFLLFFIILDSAYAQTLESDLTIQFPNFKHNKESMLKAIATNGSAFTFGNDTLKRDEFYLVSDVIHESLKNDREVLFAAIKSSSVFEELDSSFQNNHEFSLDAFKVNGFIIEYMNESFKNYIRVILEVIKNSGYFFSI